MSRVVIPAGEDEAKYEVVWTFIYGLRNCSKTVHATRVTGDGATGMPTFQSTSRNLKRASEKGVNN